MKRTFFVILCFLLIIATERFCRSKTGGFSLSKITPSRLIHEKKPLRLSKEAEKALNQPFAFLGSGAQTFVFASEDGEYVLKFFRHHRTRHLLRPFFLLLPSSLKKPIIHAENKRKLRLEKDMKSYGLATTLLPEETGIIHLHVKQTSGHFPLTLFDKIKVRHHINLEKTPFVLQKRALPLYSAIELWIEKNEWEAAQETLTNLISLLKRRKELGLADKDPDLRTNFGVIGTKPIEFDAGRLRPLTNNESSADEITRITDRLRLWLEDKAPELSLHIQHEIANLGKAL